MASTNVRLVSNQYITPGPSIMRTAFRSLVARAMMSPVRVRPIVVGRQAHQVGEQIVAQVVLDVARDADQITRMKNWKTPFDHRQPHQVAGDSAGTGCRRRPRARRSPPRRGSSAAAAPAPRPSAPGTACPGAMAQPVAPEVFANGGERFPHGLHPHGSGQCFDPLDEEDLARLRGCATSRPA